jgi:hypothetical protein
LRNHVPEKGGRVLGVAETAACLEAAAWGFAAGAVVAWAKTREVDSESASAKDAAKCFIGGV